MPCLWPSPERGRMTAAKPGSSTQIDRPVGKPKPAAKLDNRPSQVSPLGEVTRSRDAIKQSNRGNKSMGGGGISRPQGGGGGNKVGGGGGKKKFVPQGKSGGGGGGRGRR